MPSLFYEVTDKEDIAPQVDIVVNVVKDKKGRRGRNPLDLYSAMLTAQKKGGDFDLTFRDLMPVWKVQSTSVVSYHLTKLLERGLVKVKRRGRNKVYRAIEVQSG